MVSLGHAEQDLTARGEVLALLKSAGVQEAQLAVQDRKLLRKDPKLFPEDDPHLLRVVRAALDEPLALPKRLEEQAHALLQQKGHKRHRLGRRRGSARCDPAERGLHAWERSAYGY